ncbi:hypothetical protein QL285_043329 [Trifolium repens]|nr:hypothetical protein QL285_043329 [Trifolium repens]
MEGEIKPWLMYCSGETLNNLTFCSISDPTKSYSRRIPDHWRKSGLWLRTVQHGWFLWEHKISNYVSSFFLWNPLNLMEIMLPPLNHNRTRFGNWILSSPPTANDEICSIFLISSHRPSIFYYQLGDKQWTKLCSYDDIVSALTVNGKSSWRGKCPSFEDSVYSNGCLYAKMRTSRGFTIVVIEKLQSNGFSINCTSNSEYIPTLVLGLEKIISNLIGYNNVLFRIEVLHALDRVIAVHVHKFDCSQRVWKKVENIKDKVFFISSHDSAFACEAINPETEGGRIYIALKNCNFVYIYNIQDKSLATSQQFSYSSKTQTRWFMPETRMTGTLKEQIGKAHQVREREGICDVVHSKDIEDKAHNGLSLPQDVIEVIAKRITNVFDYLYFRASNKLLRLAAPPIKWRSSSSMSMSRFDDLSMCPLFVLSENGKVFTFVHPMHGLEYKSIIKFTDLQHWPANLEICCSKDGWLLLTVVHIGFQIFFNPFTKEVLPLPFGNKSIWNFRCFGMSHSPTSYECVTIELNKRYTSASNNKRHTISTAFVHHLREGRSRHIEFEDEKFPLFNISPTFHNGLFYFLNGAGNLAVIDVTREEISWKVLEEPQAPCSSHFNNFLVECDGNLLSIFENPFAKGVQVFKLIEDTMTWVKVKSLKNHMLFIGKTSFSVAANIHGMENKIYFNRFYGQSIVFYSLETNNYHTFENAEVVNFHYMREQLNGTWIQPRWNKV